MKKYIIKRDENSLPEKLTRYRQELNEQQFRVVTLKSNTHFFRERRDQADANNNLSL